MYERDFMICTLETCCTLQLKFLHLLKDYCKFIVSVCPLYPPSVDDYYYLLYSQHIDKIIKKKFVHLNDTNTLIKILKYAQNFN